MFIGNKYAIMAFPKAFQTYIPRSHCINNHVYGAILINNFNETVIIKGRVSGKWSFPKGHGESKELPLEACLRELREETGINLSGIRPDDEIRFRSGTYFVFFINNRPAIVPEDVEEVIDAKWVSIHHLPNLITNKDLTNFYRLININKILDKMALKSVF